MRKVTLKQEQSDFFNAQHPVRKLAIRLIEHLQECWRLPDWKNKKWFDMEDDIASMIRDALPGITRKNSVPAEKKVVVVISGMCCDILSSDKSITYKLCDLDNDEVSNSKETLRYQGFKKRMASIY